MLCLKTTKGFCNFQDSSAIKHVVQYTTNASHCVYIITAGFVDLPQDYGFAEEAGSPIEMARASRLSA